MQTKYSYRIDFGFGVELNHDSKPITPGELDTSLKVLIALANNCFDGCTITETFGSQVKESGQVITERGRTLTVYCDKLETYKTRRFAAEIKRELKQEAVVVCITEVHAALI